uniref:hypothetical protein n=1 Tax=Enterocloster clostridioformis TaxID=1531 RepID=UPI0025A50B04|nr:hypothetical protein [Enterocloster clostridioformis]
MKMNVYFTNVLDIGDLYLEKVLFEYDNEPIVFTCKDSNNYRYLCVCDDIIDSHSWIVTKISNEILIDVIQNRISILSAFETSGNKIIIIDYDFESDDYHYQALNFDDIDEDELPSKNQYLNKIDCFNEYVSLLKEENIDYVYNLDSEVKDLNITVKINSVKHTITEHISLSNYMLMALSNNFCGSPDIAFLYLTQNDNGKETKNESSIDLYTAA